MYPESLGLRGRWKKVQCHRLFTQFITFLKQWRNKMKNQALIFCHLGRVCTPAKDCVGKFSALHHFVEVLNAEIQIVTSKM
jgi:hypothetical protein